MSTRTNLSALRIDVLDWTPRVLPSALRPLSSVLALGLLVLGIAGCQQPQKQTPKIIVGEHSTTLEDLAIRLGLRIEERDKAFVVLKNVANTVIIFTHTDGRFFVNGKPMGTVGEVKWQGDALYVSDFLIPQIRQYLRGRRTAGGPPQSA